MKQIHSVFAPVFEHGKRNVYEIPVHNVRVVYDGKLVFINGQHYNDVYATRQEAEDYWTRARYVKPLTATELVRLVMED